MKKLICIKIRQEYNQKKKVKLNCNYIDLNDYIKNKFIGEGSFGIVYQILEKKTNDSFAAKISKNSLDCIDDEELISHFREVAIISKLSHSCILKFYGYIPTNFEKEENPVIFTDLTRKGSLSDIIKKE